MRILGNGQHLAAPGLLKHCLHVITLSNGAHNLRGPASTLLSHEKQISSPNNRTPSGVCSISLGPHTHITLYLNSRPERVESTLGSPKSFSFQASKRSPTLDPLWTLDTIAYHLCLPALSTDSIYDSLQQSAFSTSDWNIAICAYLHLVMNAAVVIFHQLTA
jgi:hypothetical protein